MKRIGSNRKFERMVRRMYKMYSDGATLADGGANFGMRSGVGLRELFQNRSFPLRSRSEAHLLREGIDKEVRDLHKIYLQSGWNVALIAELCAITKEDLEGLFYRRTPR